MCPTEIDKDSVGGGQNLQADLSAVLEDTRRLFDTAATPGETANSIAALLTGISLAGTQQESGGPATVSSGAGVGTPGAYVEMIAASGFASIQVIVACLAAFTTTGVTAIQWDLATGAAASEVDVLTKVPYAYEILVSGTGVGRVGVSVYSFNFAIAAGSRIAVRIEDSNAAAQAYRMGVAIVGA